MAFIEPMHRNKPNITYLLLSAPGGPHVGPINFTIMVSAMLTSTETTQD